MNRTIHTSERPSKAENQTGGRVIAYTNMKTNPADRYAKGGLENSQQNPFNLEEALSSTRWLFRTWKETIIDNAADDGNDGVASFGSTFRTNGE